MIIMFNIISRYVLVILIAGIIVCSSLAMLLLRVSEQQRFSSWVIGSSLSTTTFVRPLDDIALSRVKGSKHDKFYLKNHVLNAQFEDTIEVLSSEIQLNGWWQDCLHPICTIVNSDSEQNWALMLKCGNSFAPGFFQYIPFWVPDGYMVTEISLQFKARTSKLNNKKKEFEYGMLAQINYENGASTTHYLHAKNTHSSSSWTTTAETFSISKPVLSILLFLTCQGGNYNVWFDDIAAYPRLKPKSKIDITALSSIFASCPRVRSPRIIAPELLVQRITIGDWRNHNPVDSITLVSQITLHRLKSIKMTCKAWHGPIAIAIYINRLNDGIESTIEWAKQNVLKELTATHLWPIDIALVYAESNTNSYPINFMRNNAMRLVRTDYLFILDGDFLPSPGLAEILAKTITATRAAEPDAINNIAFIVPAFEILSYENTGDIPQSIQALQRAVENGKVSPFKFSSFTPAHEPTNFERWWKASETYSLTYRDRFEPYVTLKRSTKLPSFDERFEGYGMNKVSFLMELSAASFEFRVIPRGWTIHIPHERTTFMSNFLSRRDDRIRNRCDRFEFIADLLHRYELGNCASSTIVDLS